MRGTRFITALLATVFVTAWTPAYAQVVTSLSIAPSSDVTLPEGPPVQLRAIAMYSDGVPREVTLEAVWSVSDPGVLALSATPGVVRGIGAGEATVTASHSGFIATATYTVVASASAGVSRAAFVYAGLQQLQSGAASSFVERLTVDATGALTRQPGGGGTAKIHAMTMTRDSRYVFMLQAPDFAQQAQITVHRVDAGNGTLTQVPSAFAFPNGWPGTLVVDPTGQFVYASTVAFPSRLRGYYFDEQAGTLTQVADLDAEGTLAMDPAGEYLYVVGAFSLRTYRIEPTGELTLASTTPSGEVLNGISVAVHGSGDFLYVAGNPQTAKPTVLMYRLTRATGELTPIGEPVLLPIPMSAGNTAAQVMTAAVAGNFFYAGSYNDGLRAYAIDASTGQLYELAVTNPLPLHDVRAIATETGGQFLFVAARDLVTGHARIQSYALGLDGGLTTAGAFASPPSLFLYWPLVVGHTPPAGVTLDALEVLPVNKQVTISAPTGTEQFSAIGHYSDGSTAFFTSSATWSTSNPVVGSFDPLPFYNGKFTISGYGTTNVTATANGLIGTTTFAVNPVPVTALAFTTPNVSLPQGVTTQLRVTATFADATTQDVSALATWSVSDPAVLELGATPGVVRGIAAGQATVTASFSGFTATATYTVIAPTVGAGISRAAFVYAPRQHVESGATSSVMQRLSVNAAGALTTLPDAGGTTKIHAMTITRDSRYVFMLQAEDNVPQTGLTVYRVDAGNGTLTQVLSAFTSLNGSPGSVVVDPTGEFVYASTTTFPGRVRAYRFDDQAGTLTQLADLDADGVLAMDPAGQYLYVAGAFAVRTYRIEPTGALSLVSTIASSVILNGISVVVHGSGDFLYVAGNPQTFKPTVLMYRLTRASGELTAIGVPVLLPIPMSAGNTAAQVMTAGIVGNFFYAGSYNDGLRSYAIDNASGQLYEIAVTNPLPLHDVRAMAADPGGQYLFVAARDLVTGHARIQSYALGLDGGLTTAGAFATPPSLFLYWPMVVASRPPAGATLSTLEISPAGKQVTISAPTGTEQFSAIGHFSDGSTAFFTSSATWSRSNAAVGDFDPLPFYNGKFTISGYGTTDVTATVNGLTGTTTFTVSPVPVTGLALTTPSVSLPQGVTTQLRVTATYADATTQDVSALATWSVSDPAVLELGATPGVMQGIGVGVSTVTASYSGFTATATYTVVAPTAGAGVSRAAFVYAVRQQLESGASSSSVQRLSVNAAGALTLQPDGGGTTKIHAMTITRDSRYVFMLQAPDFAAQAQITVHRVDAGNGKLTQVQSAFAFLNGWPGTLVVDPTGQFVYASTVAFPSRLRGYYFDEQAGTLTQVADLDAEGTLAMDPAGQYLYVAGAFSVRTYRIEPTGELTLASTTPSGEVLNGISVAVHGSGDFLYVAGNPQTAKPTVLMYRLMRATGELTPIGEPVLLPIPMSAGNTAAQVMTAAIAGNFFYAGSYNDGLRSYAIDNASGQLYEVAVTNPLPLHDVRAIAAEPGGQYLFVAARDLMTGHARIQSYALGTNGGLTAAGGVADPPSLFLFWPLVVASRPPAGATLNTLEISPTDKQVILGTPTGTEPFNAIGHYSDGSTAFFTASTTWSTSNPAVGGFDPSPLSPGRFTIAGYGTTTITAAAGGLTATTTLSVWNVALSLSNLHHFYDGSAKAAVVTGLPPAATGLEILYNGSAQAPTAAGSYAVVARLTSPFYFAADATGTLIIEQASSETAVACSGAPTYNGLPQLPCQATVTGAGGLHLSLAVNYANNISAGNATADATFQGDANHLPSSDSTTFTIGKASSTTVVTCSAAPLTYTGASQTPCSATVTGVGGLNQSLPVVYGNNTNAGTATASAAYVGSANYTSSSAATTFVIGKANPTVTVAGYDVAFDGAAHTSTGTARGVLNETLSGLNLGATTHTAIGVYQDGWTFTDGTGNYNAVQGTVSNIIRGNPVTSVVFVFASSRDGNLEIYARRADGTEVRLTNHTASDLDPALSPDRSKILFTSTRTGNGDIYVMNVDGTGVTRLTSDSAIDGSADWSPDGRRIAFASTRTGLGDIYVMNANGTGVTRLTTDSGIDASPDWSPDGTAIAFSSSRTGLGDIYVMPASGGTQRRLTSHILPDLFPSWSPDGTRIAFSSSRDGLSDVYSMNANGTGVLRLTTHVAIDAEPAWGSDGRILFTSWRAGKVEIYVMNGNGSEQTRVTTKPGLDVSPNW